MPLRDIALALLVVVIWGYNFVVIKLGVGAMPPLLLTALRFTCAALPAVFFVKPPKTSWTKVVAFGLVLGVASFGFLIVGIKIGMPTGLSSLVLQVQAFFTMGFAVWLLDDRALPVQVGGAVVACLGIGVIASTRLEGAALTPFLMVIAAAACWGLANVIAKTAGPVDAFSFTVWSSLVAPLPLLALSFVFEGRQAIVAALSDPKPAAIVSILFQAWPTTLIGFGIWNRLLGRHPVATVAPFSLLVPVVGIASAAVFLGEPLGPVEAAGSVLVLIGLVVNVLGPRVAARARG